MAAVEATARSVLVHIELPPSTRRFHRGHQSHAETLPYTPDSLPRQNRVTPFGELIATPERGTLMGKRGGCLHDTAQRIVRPFVSRRWIACLLEFKGRRRTVMTPGRYTELFFLDEATALAAGHRPCAECQRARYDLFRAHWAGRGRKLPGTDHMDDVLHAQRIDGNRANRTDTERPSPPAAGILVADTEGP